MQGSRPALLTFSMNCDLMCSVLWVLQFITTFNLLCSGDSWNSGGGGLLSESLKWTGFSLPVLLKFRACCCYIRLCFRSFFWLQALEPWWEGTLSGSLSLSIMIAKHNSKTTITQSTEHFSTSSVHSLWCTLIGRNLTSCFYKWKEKDLLLFKSTKQLEPQVIWFVDVQFWAISMESFPNIEIYFRKTYIHNLNYKGWFFFYFT